MQLFSQYKLYIFLGVAVLLAIGAWWLLSDTSQDDALITTKNVQGVAVDKELVGTLLQLRSISLSGTIFSDPAFQQLQDFGTQIIPEPVGRPNPFAPTSYRSTSTPQGKALFPQR